MTNPDARGGLRGLRLLALVVAVVALPTGCDLATGTVRTATELEDAGIRNPDLRYDNGDARVEYDPAGGPLERVREQDRAAEVIWENLPFRLDGITVVARGGGVLDRRDYPRAVLEERFGPRPAGLDRSPGDIARRILLWATVGGLLLLLAVALIIVLVVRAVRRRPPPQPAGAWQPPSQQPWGQPGYGQQAPPPWPQQPGYGQQTQPQPPWPQQPGYGQQTQPQPPWPQQPGYGQQTQPPWPQPQPPGGAAPPEPEPPAEDRDKGPAPPP
jgi:hypothetical protein